MLLMKPLTEMLRLLVALIAACVFMTACSSSNEPEQLVDPALVGDWVHVEPDDTPTRPVNHGVRIQEDFIMKWLAVETSTGILRNFDAKRPAAIIEARSGRLVFEITSYGIGREFVNRYEISYRVSNNGLEFDTPSGYLTALLAKSYRASSVGSEVATPMTSLFEMNSDGDLFENEKFTNPDVWMGPSAYAYVSVISSRDYLVITAQDGGCGYVSIGLRDVDGPDVYILEGEAGWIEYSCFNGCVIESYRTAPHERAGEVVIESFDPSEKNCKGTFNATLKSFDDVPVSVSGRFEVPFYKATLE